MNQSAAQSRFAPKTDIPERSWVGRLPRAIQPYAKLARWDRPIGIWLLLFPCWWSVALASPGLPDGKLMVLFLIGAVMMRGAGCTMNDIVDRDFDAQVERTAVRPIPAGHVSVTQAAVFLVLQSLVGALVLFQLKGAAIVLGVLSLVLVAAYPFMKRITYWPQAFLGLTFNWGALLGWAAVDGKLAWPAIFLYGAGILWTLGYDTIYAHQDKDDDALIGVKSTALKFGDKTKLWVLGFYMGCSVLLFLAGLIAGLGPVFYLLIWVAAGQLLWQLFWLDIDSVDSCLDTFKSNRIFAVIVLAAIVIGQAA